VFEDNIAKKRQQPFTRILESQKVPTIEEGGFGGAIFFYWGRPAIESKSIIVSSNFTNNKARIGGAINTLGSNLLIDKTSIFVNNTADDYGSDIVSAPVSIFATLCNNSFPPTNGSIHP
jgi:hypothetical protein